MRGTSAEKVEQERKNNIAKEITDILVNKGYTDNISKENKQWSIKQKNNYIIITNKKNQKTLSYFKNSSLRHNDNHDSMTTEEMQECKRMVEKMEPNPEKKAQPEKKKSKGMSMDF